MTVLFAVLVVAALAAGYGLLRGERLSIARSDPAHEPTRRWPGAVAGLAAIALLALVVALATG